MSLDVLNLVKKGIVTRGQAISILLEEVRRYRAEMAHHAEAHDLYIEQENHPKARAKLVEMDRVMEEIEKLERVARVVARDNMP